MMNARAPKRLDRHQLTGLTPIKALRADQG
jgi:hypothetical protein